MKELKEIRFRARGSFVSLFSTISLISLVSLACNTLAPPRPPLEWDTSGGTVIALADTGGGMLYEPNAMADAVLYGDGTLRWVTYASGRARQVQVATLTPDEVRAVLAGFVDAGFFGWDPHYSPGLVYDAPSSCLHVTLSSGVHSVCETLSGAPRAFWRLYSDLAAGAGATGTPYMPARGYLRVTDFGPTPPGGNATFAEWPAAALGLSLADVAATDGQWLEGPALAFAWETVNAAPLNPLLRDGDHFYQAQLLVPGVTIMQPPENP